MNTNDKLSTMRIINDGGGGGGGGINAMFLNGLSIGDLSTIQNGDALIWDDQNKKWITGTPDPVIKITGIIPNRSVYIGDTPSSNQGSNSIAFGNDSGKSNQGAMSIAIGNSSGSLNQGTNSVAIGYQAGSVNQGINSIAIGFKAGDVTQTNNSIILNASGNSLSANTSSALYIDPIRLDNSVQNILYYNSDTKEIVYSNKNTIANGTNYGDYLYWDSDSWKAGSSSIKIGKNTGRVNQGSNAISIGNESGNLNQGVSSIAIGDKAGIINQKQYSVAIGYQAGYTGQGQYSIAIGNNAGQTNQPNNSIILNAGSTGFTTATQTDALYVNPIRNDDTQTKVLYYNTTTKEVVYGSTVNANSLILQADDTNEIYYVPFAKSSTGGQPLFTDPTTTPLTYNPNSSTLTLSKISNTSSLTLNTNGTDRMFINSTGNVGIGTSEPVEKLDVVGQVSIANSSSNLCILKLRENSINTPTNGGSRINLNGTRSGLSVGEYAYIMGGRENNALHNKGYFSIGVSSNDGITPLERVRINELGYFGIGTTTPATTLDVNGTIQATKIGVGTTSPTAGSILDINGVTTVRGNILPDTTVTKDIGSSSLSFGNIYTSNLRQPSSSDPLVIYTGTTEKMRVLSTGQVAIATTNATSGSILTVNGNTTVRGDILPDITVTRDIGSSSLRFNNTYSDRIITSTISSTTKYPIVSMTSNSTQGYTASSSSEYPNGLYPAYKAFDNDPLSFSHSNASLYNQSTGIYIGTVTTTVSGTAYLGEYIQLQLPSAIALNSYSLTCRPGYLSSQCPNSWIIAGSNNGTTWTLIDSKTMGSSTALSFWTSLNKKYFKVDRPGSYAYYRMICTLVGEFGNISSDRQYFVLVEVEFELFSQDSLSIIGETSIYGYTTLYGGINQKKEGLDVVAIGNNAGQYTQGENSIAIGNNTGQYTQGSNSIAIGNNAGQTNQPANSIILNANTSGFTTATQSNALYVNPIRKDNTNATQNPIYYNPNTKELTYIDQPTTQITISQKVSGETLKKDILQYNYKRMSIKNSSIDYAIDNYIDNAQEYTFGRSSLNIWVAVGTGTHTIAYSTNGKNWIGLGATIFTTRGNGVSWNGNMWVAVGSGTNSIAYSYNGLSWFSAYNSLGIFNFEGLCVTWNGTMWVAGGAGTTNTMAYSYDGINWIGLGFVFKDFCKRIEWNGTTLCAVGGGISRATFTGGFQTLGTIKVTQTFRTMCCSSSGQYQYAINPTGGSDGNYTSTQLYRSIDYGNTWGSTGLATGGTTYLQWICCSRSGQYIYFGLSNASTANVVISSDYGVTLTTKTISGTNSWAGIWVCCSGDGSIIHAIGDANYLKSTDYGNNWSSSSTIMLSGVSTSLQNLLMSISCSLDGKYVIILRCSTSIGAVFVSWDYGVNWFKSQNSTFLNITNRVSCMSTSGQYMFVTPVVNKGSYISRDYGVSWVKTTETVSGVSACCSDNFKFILSCDNNPKKIYYSSDYGNSFTDITDSSLTISVGYDSICCSNDFSYIQYVVNGSIYNRQLSSLVVTSISSGIIYPGLVLSGTGISSNTRISSFVSGSGINGSNGNYRLNTFPYFSSTTLSGTSSSIAYSTDGLNWTNNMTSVLANQGNGIGWNGNTWLSTGIGSSVFSASVGGTVQPMLAISSMSYGTIYPGLNITGGTIASNTFISNGNVTFIGSISGTSLTVTSTSGIISIGMVISGTGISTGTLISAGSGLTWTVSISQTVLLTTITGSHSGTGTAGTYYLTTSQNSNSGTTFTANSSITLTGKIDNGSGLAGTILTVTSTTGIVSIGMVLVGTGVSTGTTIISLGTGNGGVGTYILSVSQITASITITGTLTSISGQYVTIIRTSGTGQLGLNEIEVYDTSNTKITYTDANITYSSLYDTSGQRAPSFLYDLATTNSVSYNFFLTGNDGVGTTTGASNTGCWVQINFGSVKNISCIKVYNRTDSLNSEPNNPSTSIIGLKLFIKDASLNVIYTGTEISTINYSYVLFPYTVTGTLNIGTLNGRYVTFVKTGVGAGTTDNYINLGEIEIYDSANSKYTTANTTPTMTASASSIYQGYNASYLIDGIKTGVSPNFVITNGPGTLGTAGLTNTGEWVEVDLKANRTISKVLLYNRTDGLTARVLGLTMFILDESRNIIYNSSQISNINSVSPTNVPYYMLSYPDNNVSKFSYNTACTFSGSISNDILTVSSVTSGTLNVGATLTSGESTSNRYISSFLTGTGTTGTYKLSSSQILTSSTISSGAISFTGSISQNILTVTAISGTGVLSTGMILTNTGSTITSNTQILQFGTGNGGQGTYLLNNIQTVSSGTISGSFSTTFLGTISSGSNILTVNSVSIGVVYIGMVLTASGVSGSYITYFNSGTYGGTGNYTISSNASTPITSGSITGQFNSSSFTASISDYDMRVTAVSSGNIYPGTAITNGAKLLPNTFIDKQVNGPSTTVGDYTLKTFQQTQSQLFNTGTLTSITGTVSGTILTVTALTGLISIGMVLTGTNIVSNTYVTGFTSGTNGGIGTYTVSASNATTSTGAITGTLTTTFTGSITTGTNILTATTPTIGIIYLGMVLSNNVSVNNLYISGYGTGTGGAGTYILSGNASPTISNVTINGNFNPSSFTCTISGSTLNVSVLASGSIYVGSILSLGNCLGSTYISSFVSGTNGGIGVYTVNVLQSVASQTITATGLASASNTMAYSNDAVTWTSLSPNIFREGYGVSWNGKMWVVGGSGTTSSLIYSYDTLYWFGLGTTIFSKCYNLFWNGCKWIACGESTNKLAFANDTGTNWKSITSPFTTNCLDIAYNFKRDNRITLPKRLNIMLGSGTNNIQYSYNDPTSFNVAMTWTAVSSPFSISARSADYNGTLFVAGGEGQNTMAYSYDGLTWVGLGISTFSTICNFVKWNGSMWLAGGKGLSASFIGRIDGTTLTVLSNLNGKLVIGMTITGSTISAGTTITGILSQNTYTISSSQNIAQTYISASTSTGVISYSYDGLTWITSSTTFFTTSAQWADWNGKIWVCVGTGTNTIGYSTDGINWFSSDTGTILTNSFTVKWNGKIWVAGGSQICYSSDAITWYSTTSPFSAYCYSVEWNENIWVAGGSGGTTLAYSIDGITWVSAISPVLTTTCYGVYWNGSYWLAGGSGTNSYAHSLDGIRWSVGSTIFSTQGGYSAISTKKSGSLYIQHPLVAVGSGSKHTLSYSSDDGLTFTGLGTSIFPVKSTSSCWNGKLWVAGGVSNSSSFLGSITTNTTLTVSEMLYDYPTLNPNVSAWGSTSAIFSQATTDQQPTFDGASVNFNGGAKDSTTSGFLTTSSLTLRIFEEGGFTAIVYVKFTGTPAIGERIFDFTNGINQVNDTIILHRETATANLNFRIFNGTTTSVTRITVGNEIVQGEWMTVAVRYNAIGPTVQLYKNKTLITGGTTTVNNVSTRASTNYNYIGKSSYPSVDGYFTGSIGGLLVYDRALSDTELNTATDALVNKTLNFSTTNLKVRLLVMPNSGKIYPGMTLSGSGITSNTKITSGPTTGAIGTYKITSSSNVSTNTIVNATSSSLAYSYDALTWIPLGNSIFSNVCNNITWTGSQFVAVGEGTVSFVGSISTTTLTVTSVLTGTIYVGMTIYGSGITASTKITAFVSGIGSVGTYTVSQSQTISSQIMNGTPITVAYSSDGINWTPTQNQISSGADSVIYDGKKSVVSSTGFTSFIGRIDNGTGTASGNTLTVSEVLYDYPIANPSVSRWNTFSQYTTAQQPTFDGVSVNFNRTNSEFLTNSNLTLNIDTNGGFTAIVYLKFTGTAALNERIFDFGSGQGNNNLMIARFNSNVYIFNGFITSTHTIGIYGGNIIQNEWHTISVVYTKGATIPFKMYKNKTLLTTTPIVGSNTSTTTISNRTLTSNYIGKSNWSGDPYFNGSIGGLLVYDRALSDTELNNATDALVNKTLNFPIDNLKVRLLIMNPNPSLIYPGMRISGAGITDGTIISSYGTGSGGAGTYTVNGSSQTITPALINASNVNISSSTDLVTWTGSGTTNLPALGINGIAYNGNRYVAVGGGIVSFSGRIDNGTVGNPGTILTVSAVYSGSLYIGMTIYASGVTNTLITAYGTGSGGIGTYNVTVSQNVTGRTIYGNPITMAYSSDLSTWSPVTNTQFTNQGNSVSWNGRTMVAVGDGTDDILYSSDGVSWAAVSNSNTLLFPNPNAVYWTGKKWIACGPVTSSSFTGSISGTTLTISAFTNSPLIYVGMLISGVGVSPGTKIVSGTSSPYTVNISQIVSSTTMTGVSNASVYSYDGVNWSDMGTSALITSQCNGIFGNSRVGTVVVDSQSVIDGYGAGLTDSFELVSDKYYNNDYNTFSVSISSNQI